MEVHLRAQQEAVERLLAHDTWFQQQVQVASNRSRAASSSKKTKWMRALSACFSLE
jgi:hypothetical protein